MRLTEGPMIIVHLEDPPGSQRAGCSGKRLKAEDMVPDHMHPHIPRVLCPGCEVKAKQYANDVRPRSDNRVGSAKK